MNMRVATWSAIALATMLLAPTAARPAETPAASAREADATFAVVDGVVISAREFDNAFAAAVRQKFYHRQPPEGQLDAFRREVGDRMINRVLLLAEAKRRAVAADADKVGKAIAGYEERYRDSPQWQKSRDTLLPGLKRELEQQSILERLETSVRRVPEPGDAELRAYFQSNPALFTEPEQVRLSVILLKVDPSSPKATWDKAREEAGAILKRLRGGADFAALAAIHSTDASAQNGGDMGYLHRGMLPEGVHGQIDAMKPGTLSEPVTLLEGVAVIRLVDRKEARQRNFDSVRKRAAELWQREQSDRKWNDFVAGLRAKATVRIDTARFPELAVNHAGGRAAGTR